MVEAKCCITMKNEKRPPNILQRSRRKLPKKIMCQPTRRRTIGLTGVLLLGPRSHLGSQDIIYQLWSVIGYAVSPLNPLSTIFVYATGASWDTLCKQPLLRQGQFAGVKLTHAFVKRFSSGGSLFQHLSLQISYKTSVVLVLNKYQTQVIDRITQSEEISVTYHLCWIEYRRLQSNRPKISG